MYRAWVLRDRDGMLAYYADDAFIAQYVSKEALPFAGVSIGKGLFSERLDMIFNDWDFEHIKLSRLTIVDDAVRCHVDFKFRYKRTGDLMEGRMRHVFHIVDGRIASLDEYHDASMVEAFMRLAHAREKESQSMPATVPAAKP